MLYVARRALCPGVRPLLPTRASAITPFQSGLILANQRDVSSSSNILPKSVWNFTCGVFSAKAKVSPDAADRY
jgi:hypothetical protein